MSLRSFVAALLFFSWAQLSAQYVINTFAGGGTPPPLPATSVGVGEPAHIAADTTGNIYITSYTQNRIYKVDATGTLTTVAGNGGMASTFDVGVGPALATAVYFGSIALDPAGNLYMAGRECCVLKLSNGIITLAAGNGTAGFSGDGGPAVAASLFSPGSLAVDNTGNLYIADVANFRVRKVTNGTGIITTVAGDGTRVLTSPPDNVPATSVSVGDLTDLAIDSAGTLYIAHNYYNPGNHPLEVTNGLMTALENSFGYVTSVAADTTGNVYFADYANQQVRRINNGSITSVAGEGSGSYLGDGAVATSADLAYPTSVAVDREGNVFVADSGNNRIRRVTNGHHHNRNDSVLVHELSRLSSGGQQRQCVFHRWFSSTCFLPTVSSRRRPATGLKDLRGMGGPPPQRKLYLMHSAWTAKAIFISLTIILRFEE
jgi:streptogramin lyase